MSGIWFLKIPIIRMIVAIVVKNINEITLNANPNFCLLLIKNCPFAHFMVGHKVLLLSRAYINLILRVQYTDMMIQYLC
jgi:hypothetical protein